MTWLHVLILAFVSVTAAGCELAGDIFQAGVWVGAIIIVGVIAIVGFIAAKLRS